MNVRVCVKAVLLSVLFLGLVTFTYAQSANIQSRINQAIDEKNLVVLKGNTHPFAAPEFDRGAAPGSLQMNRMLMVLSHTPEQETAIRTLMAEQQNQASPYFHQWLTPAQYGQMFGPSDADIQKITSWLESHGFQVAQVSPGKHIIEFSGTASQVQEAFHTSIHQYSVNGENHWANSSDPQIPAALASVVVGVKSLHNFHEKPTSHFAGTYRHEKATGKLKQLTAGSEFTFTQNGSTFFALGPADFATIYNVQPLWNAGIDGTGETIAIVQESNINIQDIRDFRTLFGLPANDPEIVLDGPDPGIIPNIEPEAVIDVSWSGAVAKGAKIKMVVSSSTNTTSGISLSALYIADHNIASISSMSFGSCELHLGTAGNTFWNAVWEQAAAEGISAFVSAGDGGSAGCDNFDTARFARDGLAVSGDASTPFDIAVGGTDFGGNFFDPAAFWSPTNDPVTQGSALSYVPELPWNDSCANSLFSFIGGSTDPIVNCNNPAFSGFLNIVGGSGGASSCISSDGRTIASCTGGHPKPSWQTGVGVPADGVRDIPDVSLFASNGFLGSFYIICEADLNPPGSPNCDLNPPFQDFAGFGGTSVSSPAFAGILALVNQKTHSRQGNANFVFYKLAADEASNLANCNVNAGPILTSFPAASCIFNDITADTNAVPCLSGSPNCNTEGTDKFGVLAGYNSGVGYDLTTGLGSVNAANLVNNWKSVTFTPTVTLLKVRPEILVHGQAATVDVAVIASSGTPTGDVALKNNRQDAAGFLTLGPNGTLATTTHVLPGGPSLITADYFGDGTFAHSDSNPVPVFVFPEPSTTAITLFSLNATRTQFVPFSAGPYGSIVFLRADVAGKSGFGDATGNVIFTDNHANIKGDPFRLNSEGNTLTPNSIDTFSVGTHTIRADYEGDASFLPSDAKPVTFNITMAPTTTTLAAGSATATQGSSVTLTATVNTGAQGDADPPSGKVTFFVGLTRLANVHVTGGVDPKTGLANATATLTITNLPVGADSITATYDGDKNYNASSSAAVTVTVSAATP
jgi:Pro-kumamolisin, activation domain/Bacterial Ig-like domain (group 3)/Subtilase family